MTTNEMFNQLVTDHAYFLHDMNKNNWASHRTLLLLALHLTKGTVIELGSGDYSTPYLKRYCKQTNRHFLSFDNSLHWCKRHNSIYIDNWEKNNRWLHRCGVAFIDHAPGEHRKIALQKLAPLAQIIVVHDTELNGAGDYKLEPVFSLFKYRLNYNIYGNGAGATAVSNTININKYAGASIGNYVFDEK